VLTIDTAASFSSKLRLPVMVLTYTVIAYFDVDDIDEIHISGFAVTVISH
jgi:hypothetical protein